jgi:hypothetical protein
MLKKLVLIFVAGFFLISNGFSQQISAEDSLQQKASDKHSTYIGGYGDISYQRNNNLQQAEINLNRAVVFIGHRFNNKISFFSELELEDAKIAGGEPGGEFAAEQAYLKFTLNKNIFISAGLFIPRIGLLNENHLPAEFNGVERPIVEQYVIPSTWRELGIGISGKLERMPLNYTFAVCNGLNSASFEHGSGIREGRYEGRNASANNLAITGSLQFIPGLFRFQISGYMGGTVGLPKKEADSLKLNSGIFGTPVILGEANVQFENKGFAIKALASVLSLPDAEDINRVYDNNTARVIYGAYAEASYNIFETISRLNSHKLILFARYEKLDLNSSIPQNGIFDGTLKQDHLIAGLFYLPINNVIIKADLRLQKTAEPNDALTLDPESNNQFKTTNTFLNLGLGYSF